jgi:hypothetical protein
VTRDYVRSHSQKSRTIRAPTAESASFNLSVTRDRADKVIGAPPPTHANCSSRPQSQDSQNQLLLAQSSEMSSEKNTDKVQPSVANLMSEDEIEAIGNGKPESKLKSFNFYLKKPLDPKKLKFPSGKVIPKYCWRPPQKLDKSGILRDNLGLKDNYHEPCSRQN